MNEDLLRIMVPILLASMGLVVITMLVVVGTIVGLSRALRRMESRMDSLNPVANTYVVIPVGGTPAQNGYVTVPVNGHNYTETTVLPRS